MLRGKMLPKRLLSGLVLAGVSIIWTSSLSEKRVLAGHAFPGYVEGTSKSSPKSPFRPHLPSPLKGSRRVECEMPDPAAWFAARMDIQMDVLLTEAAMLRAGSADKLTRHGLRPPFGLAGVNPYFLNRLATVTLSGISKHLATGGLTHALNILLVFAPFGAF